MKVVRLSGGLGNQMFQYAFIKNMQIRFKEKIKIDAYLFKNSKFKFELNYVFNITSDINFIDRVIINLSRIWNKYNFPGQQVFNLYEMYIENEPSILNNSNYSDNFYLKLKGKKVVKVTEKMYSKGYFIGYFQNFQNFHSIKKNLLKEFTFPDIKDKKNQEIVKLIEKSNSVSVHVRRGDYLNHDDSIYPDLCKGSYYDIAIERIKSKVENPVYFIFSNDIEWAKTRFSNLDQIYFIDWNQGCESYRDMQLMSLCKHNIIANSTFSWWAAYLNQNLNSIIISPDKWYKNLLLPCPPNWIILCYTT